MFCKADLFFDVHVNSAFIILMLVLKSSTVAFRVNQIGLICAYRTGQLCQNYTRSVKFEATFSIVLKYILILNISAEFLLSKFLSKCIALVAQHVMETKMEQGQPIIFQKCRLDIFAKKIR
jgi:hypothetical protein